MPATPTTARMTAAELRRRAGRLPRVRLAHLPTPLEEMPRLSAALGGPRIFMKRDDCTGLAFGGNKTRHNEFILALAQARGADMLVWGAGVQSNNCRQTAAGCAKLGLGCHLVLSTSEASPKAQGNLLLDYMFGASVEFTPAPIGTELWEVLDRAAERYAAQGKKVFRATDPAVRPSAAVGYALALAELADQLAERELMADAIYVSSTGATGAGLFLGKALLGLPGTLRAVMPIAWPGDNHQLMADIGNQAGGLLGSEPCLRRADVDATADFIAPGYGLPSPAGMEATRLVAQTEGIVLDPIYTAKAMAALVADIRRGEWDAGQNVVFFHSGGTPALFAYHRELAAEFGAHSEP